MRKMSFDTLAYEMLNRIFKETVGQFIADDKAYNFKN